MMSKLLLTHTPEESGSELTAVCRLFKDGKLTSWTENEGLPSRTIRALYEDADDALWIGTYDGGLARFKDGKFTHYNSSIGLYNDGAFQILEDEQAKFLDFIESRNLPRQQGRIKRIRRWQTLNHHVNHLRQIRRNAQRRM